MIPWITHRDIKRLVVWKVQHAPGCTKSSITTMLACAFPGEHRGRINRTAIWRNYLLDVVLRGPEFINTGSGRCHAWHYRTTWENDGSGI